MSIPEAAHPHVIAYDLRDVARHLRNHRVEQQRLKGERDDERDWLDNVATRLCEIADAVSPHGAEP